MSQLSSRKTDSDNQIPPTFQVQQNVKKHVFPVMLYRVVVAQSDAIVDYPTSDSSRTPTPEKKLFRLIEAAKLFNALLWLKSSALKQFLQRKQQSTTRSGRSLRSYKLEDT